MNGKWTFLILLFGVVALFMLNAWVESLQIWLFKIFHLDRSSASAWLALAIMSTLIFLILLASFNIELHDIIGISETVDRQLTGQKEVFKKGKVVQVDI